MRIHTDGKVGIGIATPADALSVTGVISSTGNKVKFADKMYDPPAPDYALSLTNDHTVWLQIDAPAGTDNTVTLPSASSAAIGHQFRLIVKLIAGGKNVKVAVNSSNEILSETGSVLNGSGNYALTAGKIYDIICVSGSQWLLLTLNWCGYYVAGYT